MEDSARKKILVAVDGSESALEAVRYVGCTLPPRSIEVTLFHVMTRVPESFWDLEKDHAYQYRIASVRAWETGQEEAIKAFMTRARQIILDCGIPQEALAVKIEDRKVGIARDIVEESRNGYSAVVVGRRGLSQLKDLIIGSTAHKLVEKVAHIPVWIVGGVSHGQRVLIAMDPSKDALRAVDYVGAMLGGSSGYELLLFHAVRGFDVVQQILGRPLLPDHQEEWARSADNELEEAEKEMGPTFAEARKRLEGLGVELKWVKQKVATGVTSRAGAIVDEAVMGRFDTIVVGRRGLSKVREFFMGRVGNKVIQLTKDRTVWVVS